ACNLLKDPQISPYCVSDAQRLSKFDGTSSLRFVDEPYTADSFWNAQVYFIIAHSAVLPVCQFIPSHH
ncbi:hypothetical protein PAXRUDRAFT_159113, partial [Paxillus rubicundulus Ve08.2h10]